MPTSYEVATNAARGVLPVADRKFVNRRLTLAEQARHRAGLYAPDQSDLSFVVTHLNNVRLDRKESAVITAEWVSEHLTAEELRDLILYTLNGPDALTLDVARRAKELELAVLEQDRRLEEQHVSTLAILSELSAPAD